MHRLVAALLAALSLAGSAAARDGRSPYAGQEGRQIKALSPEEVRALLAGEGMGLARAAELNHYPGPRHVLDLAGALGLTPAQVEATRRVEAGMRADAVRLGRAIIEKEQLLDRLYAEQRIDERQLERLVSEIAQLEGALRTVHLRAHLEMKRLLSPEQVAEYDRLRGYVGGPAGGPAGGHRHGE